MSVYDNVVRAWAETPFTPEQLAPLRAHLARREQLKEFVALTGQLSDKELTGELRQLRAGALRELALWGGL